MQSKDFKTSHELAHILLSLPDVQVTTLQHYNSQYSHSNSVRFGIEQIHSTGEVSKDENGNIEEFIRID